MCKGDEQLLQKYDKEVNKIIQIVSIMLIIVQGIELQKKLKAEISENVESDQVNQLIKLLYQKNLIF